jgi:hypothetical protein
MLKAALSYADRLKVCCVGAAFMSGLQHLRSMDVKSKTAIVRNYLPVSRPSATREDLEALVPWQLREI